ncbi:MAG: XdhC/CoxI family protein, partial [Oscillospiraceae bacterium]|nr:XdhC/CoxI family protein [Oscillospiraceae bacterium]
MKKVAKSIVAALARGEKVVLVTVIDSSGSTPRKAGSFMVMFADRHTEGTIGGGAIEFETQIVAEGMLTMDVGSQTVGYSLASTETGDVCMICGGDVYVHYHTVEPTRESVALFQAVEEATELDEDSWLVARIVEGEPTRLAVYADGLSDFGSGITESEVLPYLKRKPFVTDEEDEQKNKLIPRWYTVPLAREGHVFIFGAGHVGQEIAPALTKVGFSCVIYDDRPDFAREELFPTAAKVVCASFKEITENVEIGAAD